MAGYNTILFDIDSDGIATCVFNRPEVRNALNQAMVDEMRGLLADLASGREANALIFAGAGDKAFLGGADVRELRDRTSRDALRRINSGLFREVEQFPLPTIAAIHGAAVGGGLELALACDLRICEPSARFGQPELGIGIIPGAGGTYRLPRVIGMGRAKDLILTGRIVSGEEALEMGLVCRLADDGTVLEEARELARTIIEKGPLAIRLAKAALNAGPEMSVDAAMALESAIQAVLFDDEEKMERMTAFLEKRK
jgi:enoyl-CoA hydratase